MFFSRPIQWYNSLADLIWPDMQYTFKLPDDVYLAEVI